jgi:hypothetical protein
MPEHDTPEQKGYELSDVQLRVVLWSGVTVVLLTLAAYIVSTFLVKYSNAQPPISDYTPTPMAIESRGEPFEGGVRLQVEPGAALVEFRAEQHRQATTYGTVSDEPEIYRIPISRAIDVVAQRGLPVFPVTTPPPSAGGAQESP